MYIEQNYKYVKSCFAWVCLWMILEQFVFSTFQKSQNNLKIPEWYTNIIIKNKKHCKRKMMKSMKSMLN